MASIRNSLDEAVSATIFTHVAGGGGGAGFDYTVPPNTVEELLLLSFEYSLAIIGNPRQFYINLDNSVLDEPICFAYKLIPIGTTGFMMFAQGVASWANTNEVWMSTPLPTGLRTPAGSIYTLGFTNANVGDNLGNITVYTRRWTYPS